MWNCASEGSGRMEEILKVPLGVFKAGLAEAATLTMDGCARIFHRLDGEVWKTTCLFAFPLHETAPPNLKVQPPKMKEDV